VSGSVVIPFLDLVGLHSELEDELCSLFKRSLQRAEFIGGPMVEDFESDFSGFCGTDYCIGVGSGTDALRFALIAAGITRGSIIVTVPNTFIATVEAISQSGAIPAFVDVDPRTYNMDPAQLEQFLESECVRNTNGTQTIHRASSRPVSAVIPVHLYGQMADMDRIEELAERYGLMVIEDACQAHGARYFSQRQQRWRNAGSIGRAAAFSFYPGKNLGACGEGGAITTSDPEFARIARMLRDHGQSKKYYHEIEGYNGRLDAIQAAVLKLKLGHLPAWNAQRRMRAAHYSTLLCAAHTSITAPYEPSWSEPVYHLYVVQVAERALVQQHLRAEGIATAIHYPVPLHLQQAYSNLGYKQGDFPVAEAAAERILSLPMYPGLTSQQQRHVVEVLLNATQTSIKDSTLAVSAH
jgi:dTDP-4-amino-4,6-dideoxygalactose transaminase